MTDRYPSIQLYKEGKAWFARFDPQPYGTVAIELTDYWDTAPEIILSAISRLNPESRVTLGVLNWE